MPERPLPVRSPRRLEPRRARRRSEISRERRRAIRSLMILFLIVVLILVAAGGVYVWATGASGPQRSIAVEVPEGSSASDFADLLSERGVIRSPLAFRVMANVRGMGNDLLAGRYELTTNMELGAVFDVLELGPVPDPTLTLSVPEGLRLDQLAVEVAQEVGVRPQPFLEAAESGSYSLLPYLPEDAETVEGFLFPKTYEFPDEVDADEVITRMLDQFEREVADLPWQRADDLGVSPYEVVTIASMIEREANLDSERRRISAVIYNRLEAGMLLQIDATVLYALPNHKQPTKADLEIDSPYNTYLHPGLPPTPIAAPGLASLEAALDPADVEFLFYVLAQCDGRHAFSKTDEEHQRKAAQAPDCD